MAADLTNSSTSSLPVVLKILIDLDKYHRLLEKKLKNQLKTSQQQQDRQEKKPKDQLETFQRHQRKRNRLKDRVKMYYSIPSTFYV